MIMETNIMSKEQAQDVVRNTKYILKSKDENANLQKKLFEIGCRWISGCEDVKHEDNKYLFVSKNLCITTSNANDLFMEDKKEKLQVNDVLNIELKDMEMETKLKFKVGDKVKVKSLEWYDGEKKDRYGDIEKGYNFTKEMAVYCKCVLIIKKVCKDFYVVNENNKYWQDWMLEDEVITEEKQII